MKKKNNNKGITLIALVITIIVLLILAGVSIAMLTGQNGILTQAQNAKTQTEYSSITDSMSLAVTEYNTLKQTDSKVAETSFIDWLKGKGYINDNNEIQVANLLGQTMSTGNGTGTSDVYKIEEVTKTAKVASTIKVGVVEAEIEKEYRIVYYDKKGTPTELKTFTLNTPEELEETDPSLFIVEDGVISLKDYDAYYNGSEQWTIENVVIPSEVEGEEVKYLGDAMFADHTNRGLFDTIANIVIPETVKSVGAYAFSGCTSLNSVNLPKGLEYIGERAFQQTGLKEIIIPETVKSVGADAFSRCTSLNSVNIPQNITKIEPGTFYECSSLESINLPNELETIGDDAFYGSGLKEIIIPNGVKYIGETALLGRNIEKINVENGNTEYTSNDGVLMDKLQKRIITYPSKKKDTQYSIPDSITSIGISAFSGCTELTSINIPSNVTSIEERAFSYCTALTGISLPSSITEIEIELFSGCTSLTSVEIPDSIISIGWHAFSDCTALTSISLPNSITEIEIGSFYGCTSLMSVEIPDSITSIRAQAFYECTSLMSVKIPDSIISIEDNAFVGCTSIPNINIPSSVKEVGEYVFVGWTENQTVNVPIERDYRPTGWDINWKSNCYANIVYAGE